MELYNRKEECQSADRTVIYIGRNRPDEIRSGRYFGRTRNGVGSFGIEEGVLNRASLFFRILNRSYHGESIKRRDFDEGWKNSWKDMPWAWLYWIGCLRRNEPYSPLLNCKGESRRTPP